MTHHNGVHDSPQWMELHTIRKNMTHHNGGHEETSRNGQPSTDGHKDEVHSGEKSQTSLPEDDGGNWETVGVGSKSCNRLPKYGVRLCN